MDKNELLQILPHRDQMLLLDDAQNCDGEAVGHYTVRGDEFFRQGHFPGNPIVPGVILCEILAQSVCVLVKDKLEPGKIPVYAGMNNIRFRSMVKPGDMVETKCRIKREKHPFYFAEGTVCVGNRLCASGEFSFAITGA